MNIFQRIAFWLVWHVPMGSLAPQLMAFALGNRAYRIVEQCEKENKRG